MNKKLLVAALGVFALIAAAVPAYAQSSTPTGLSLKIGVLWPTDEDVRDATSDTWFTGGLEYRFKEMPMTSDNGRAHLSVSFDWAENDDVRIMPLLLNYVGENNQTYWMVGIGWAFLDAPGFDDSEFAWQAGFGFNFANGGSTPMFVEARYVGTSESSANAVIINFGIRM
jgi:hypothetical protein